jgi:hypothetical protein
VAAVLFVSNRCWPLQISASGKTTSLGDHDTEEEAARAFDRAAINIKGGTAALINFDVSEYADEVPRLVTPSFCPHRTRHSAQHPSVSITLLSLCISLCSLCHRSPHPYPPRCPFHRSVTRQVKMSQTELVAELRARARKAGRSSSKFRGVTLLKATGQWHAQFNLQGKQLHLGFFDDEVSAARAADVAALFFAEPAAMTNVASHVPTNLPCADYLAELPTLRCVPASLLTSSWLPPSRQQQMHMCVR